MEVYILTQEDIYDRHAIHGVFSTFEKAQEFANKHFPSENTWVEQEPNADNDDVAGFLWLDGEDGLTIQLWTVDESE